MHAEMIMMVTFGVLGQGLVIKLDFNLSVMY